MAGAAKPAGSIFHTKERGRLQALMDTGMTDLFRHRYPDAQEFSWWDYRGSAFMWHGLRIDFTLRLGIVDLTEEVVIDREYRRKIDELTASDHAPVYADISL